ncbi:MAG: ATP-binding protein [Ottowia sp.]
MNDATQPHRTNPAAPPAEAWRTVFCGRQKELDALMQAFEDVRAGRGPRMVVILGDRGMGKTRLVQEFYKRLSGSEHDRPNYWPPSLPDSGVAPNLKDPQVEAHYKSFTWHERPIPYLWWGLRLADDQDRNRISIDMSAHRKTLEPHLGAVIAARALAEHQGKTSAAAGEVLLDLGKWALGQITQTDNLMTALDFANRLIDSFKSRQQNEAEQSELKNRQVLDFEARRQMDIQERTLLDLGLMLGESVPPAAEKAGLMQSLIKKTRSSAPAPAALRIPCIVFCDDAQFARQGGDGACRPSSRLFSSAPEWQAGRCCWCSPTGMWSGASSGRPAARPRRCCRKKVPQVPPLPASWARAWPLTWRACRRFRVACRSSKFPRSIKH